MKSQNENPLERMAGRIDAWLKTNEENQKAVRPLAEILKVFTWAIEAMRTVPPDLPEGPVLA